MSIFRKFRQRRVKTYQGETYKNSIPVFSPSEGIDKSMPPFELPNNFISGGLNVWYSGNKLCTRPGYTTFGNGLPLPSPVVLIEQFFKFDGSEYLCVFTTTDIYKYNTSTKYFDLITPNVEVCDCESAWTASANVTATASTAWKRYGTYSAKLAIAAGFTTGLAAYKDISSADLTDYTTLHFYIKSSVATAAGDLKILLDDTSGCVSPLESIDIPALAADTATEVNVTIATPAALGAVISVGIYVATDLGVQDVYIDDIRATSPYGGSVTDRWNTETIYDTNDAEVKFIATNGVDAPQFWNASGNWGNLGGSPNISNFIINFFNHLMLMEQIVSGAATPQRIQWSVAGQPEDWSSAGSGNNSLAASYGFIMGCEDLKGQIAILKERSIAMCYLTGTDPPFGFDENKIVDVGCAASGSIQPISDCLLFLGWDDFYLFDGFTCSPQGERIKEYFFDMLDAGKLSYVHTHIYEEQNLYILFCVTVGHDTPDIAFIFDYDKERWLPPWEFYDSITATGYYQNSAAKTIGEILETIGSLNWRIGSRALQSVAPVSIFGSYDGYLYRFDPTKTSDNGNAIDSYFDTKSFIVEIGKFTRWCELAIYGIGDTVDIYVSKDDGKNWVLKDTFELGEDEDDPYTTQDIDTTSEKCMIRIRCNTLDEWFKIAGWDLRYIKKEVRP